MNEPNTTMNAASQSDIPQSVSDFTQRITDLCGSKHARWAENFNAGFANTLTTIVKRYDADTTFPLTGRHTCPMWLRDFSAQFRPYFAVAVDDPELLCPPMVQLGQYDVLRIGHGLFRHSGHE